MVFMDSTPFGSGGKRNAAGSPTPMPEIRQHLNRSLRNARKSASFRVHLHGTAPALHMGQGVFMILLKKILVATDFSEPSGVALTYGRDLARSYGATLHVLHVVESMAALLADAESIGV